jgi:hypothetical protein
MTISLYDASVPVFKQMMGTLSIILDKAEKHAKSENIAQEALLSAPLPRHVRPDPANSDVE